MRSYSNEEDQETDFTRIDEVYLRVACRRLILLLTRLPLLLLLLLLFEDGNSIEKVRLGRLTEVRSKVDTELIRRLN